METIACDFCGTDASVPVVSQTDKLHSTTDEFFTIVRCSNCGLHYTNPRPSPNEIGRYYAENYAFHANPSVFRRLLVAVAERVASGRFAFMADIIPLVGRRLAMYLKPVISDPVRDFYSHGGQGAFLDIGCGAGSSAHFWGQSGALLTYRNLTEVAGIEVADNARKTLASNGIAAWSDIDDVPSERRFGMIRMNWSLEHVHSPSRYFTFLRNRLLKGGKAIIAVPNYGGMIYRLAPDCVELPIHLYHFRPLDLENYATRHGLRIISLRTFSYPQMFVAAAQSGLFPETFAAQPSLREASAFQLLLKRFDQVNWGNDMIAELVIDE